MCHFALTEIFSQKTRGGKPVRRAATKLQIVGKRRAGVTAPRPPKWSQGIILKQQGKATGNTTQSRTEIKHLACLGFKIKSCIFLLRSLQSEPKAAPIPEVRCASRSLAFTPCCSESVE